MTFEDIKFVRRGGSLAVDLGLYLPGPFWVYHHTVLEAWVQARTSLPTLNRLADFKTKMLWDERVWNSFPSGKQLALGRCIRYFADNDMLPYQLLNPGKKTGTKRYRRT